MQETKAKINENKFRIGNGCLRAFLFALAFPIVSCMGLWLFARFGGEWASSLSIPIPPDSRILDVSYEHGYLNVIKTTVYENTTSPEELREWFIQTGISMTPINEEDVNLVENYYNLGPSSALLSPIQENHYFASVITHGWWDDMMPTCQSIQIYKQISLAIADYPNFNFSGEATVIVITNCWAAN